MDFAIFDRQDGVTEFVNMDHVLHMRQSGHAPDNPLEDLKIEVTFSNKMWRVYTGLDALALIDAIIAPGDPHDTQT